MTGDGSCGLLARWAAWGQVAGKVQTELPEKTGDGAMPTVGKRQARHKQNGRKNRRACREQTANAAQTQIAGKLPGAVDERQKKHYEKRGKTVRKTAGKSRRLHRRPRRVGGECLRSTLPGRLAASWRDGGQV